VIAGVVLAAGLSRRMGRPKLLLPLDGRPLISHTVEALAAVGLDDLIVVVPPESDALRAALEGLAVRFAVNPAPEAGQAGSVVAGVAALAPTTEAALIALGDQPGVPGVVVASLLEAYRSTGMPIVAPRYREGRGNPVLFAAAVFSELLRLRGDQGARAVIDADPARVALVPFDLPMPRDLDTPEDYESLRRHR
jgi:molybdenum cofactor cytidylyltransferase